MLQLCSLPAAVAIEGRDDEEGMRRDGNRTQAWAQFIYLHKVNDVEGNSCAFNRSRVLAISILYVYVCAVYEYVHNVNALDSCGSTRCVYLMCRHFAYLCLLLVVVVVVSVLYADMLFNRSRCYRHSQIRADTLNMIVCWRWCYSRRRQSALAWAWLGLAWIAFVWFGLGNFAPHGTDFCRMNANHLHTHTRVYTGHTHRHTSAQ